MKWVESFQFDSLQRWLCHTKELRLSFCSLTPATIKVSQRVMGGVSCVPNVYSEQLTGNHAPCLSLQWSHAHHESTRQQVQATLLSLQVTWHWKLLNDSLTIASIHGMEHAQRETTWSVIGHLNLLLFVSQLHTHLHHTFNFSVDCVQIQCNVRVT